MRKDIAVDLKKVRDKLDEVKKCVSQAKWDEDANKIRTEMDCELTKVNSDLTKIKETLAEVNGMREVGHDGNNGEELKKLEHVVNEMKNEIDSRSRRTVKVVKEDVEQALEIERRRLNLVIHGVPESAAEHDIDQIAEILATACIWTSRNM